MEEQKNPREISLPCCSKYTSLTCAGCCYYAIKQCSKCVYRLDKNFCEIGKIKTCREYNVLSYDCRNCCFWAASEGCKGFIFKLDCDFDEIDKFYVVIRGKVEGIVTGISVDSCKNDVLVSFTCGVVAFSVDSECSSVLCCTNDGMITGVLAIHPYYMVIATYKCKQYIIILDEAGNKIRKEYVPQGCIVEQIIYCCCRHKSYFVSLVEKKGCYQKIIIDKAKCFTERFGIRCCDMYEDNCCSCCKDDTQCNTDLIESIALIEAAMAHILNAEGEKLQKILATTNDYNKIMNVNKEINQTIINATQLEQVLYQKLMCAKEIKSKPICNNDCDDSFCYDNNDFDCEQCID